MIVSSLFFACGDKSNDTTSESDGSCTFESIDGEGIAEGFELVGDSFSIDFTEDPREMSFNAGCNTHGGEYKVVDGVFQMSELYSTYMDCETSLMDQDGWLTTWIPPVQLLFAMVTRLPS